jgi:hypothetical protein
MCVACVPMGTFCAQKLERNFDFSQFKRLDNEQGEPMVKTIAFPAFLIPVALAASAFAQEMGQAYRLVYQTVYDQQEITAYRIENELVYDEQQQTTYRPVYETELREQRYTVTRPVTETSEREERYKVTRPVWETQVRDSSYDVVRSVPETSEREERYTMSRPVYETQEREERYVVRRQVLETAERDEATAVVEPVTTYQTNYVDQGQFVDQQVVTPGTVHNRLRWLPAACAIDPLSGASTYQRGGLAWVPEAGPARVTMYRAWQPNVVAQQVPQTTYVQRIVTRKVPVQVARLVDEEVVRKVPVQVCKIVQEEQVRRVPVTTYRQVVERVKQETPVQVCKMVEEEVVRRVPVTTCRMVSEERVEQIPVQVCKIVAVPQTVRVARVVEKRVPVTYTQQVPRTVVMRVPLETCAPPPVCCDSAPAIVVPATTITPSNGTFRSQPTPASPDRSDGKSSYDKSSGNRGNATKRPSLGSEEKIGPVDEEAPER